MKLLEYEAKQLLHRSGVPIPMGSVLRAGEPHTVTIPAVLKSQVPVGGRGKAGGILLVDDPDSVESSLQTLFSLEIKGHTPNAILAEEKLAIEKEFYFSLVLNRAKSLVQLIAHIHGGVEVEENEPESFATYDITDPTKTTFDDIGQQLADYYDLNDYVFVLQDLVEQAYSCFLANDATLLEINPLVVTTDGKLVAGDCKMTLDDAAAFRHPDWSFEDKAVESNFVTLHETGTIATIANGAGLAMATVDAVANAGRTPANFLDIGGGANAETVLVAFRRIMEFPAIEAIVINIFAGITRCDEVAKAIIEAHDHIDNLPPLFIRLAGTNYEAAATLLEERGITTLPTLEACINAAAEVTHE